MKTTKNFRPLVTSIGVEYDRYLVSDTGEIFDKSTNTFLEPYNSTNGHDYIILDTFGGKRIELIENIVFRSFGLLIPLDLMDCDILIQHYNGNSRDNFVDNLYPIKDIEIYKDIVYDLVKDIPYMNREKVYRISVKDSWKNISDEYF